MELWDEAMIAVFVPDQPFSDGFLVHGKKRSNAIMPPINTAPICLVPVQEAA